jgi:NADPH2:quinone reductase
MLAPWLRDLVEPWQRQNEILKQCGRWIDEGKLRINVSDRLSLSQAAEAHRRIESGHQKGKIVLLP